MSSDKSHSALAPETIRLARNRQASRVLIVTPQPFFEDRGTPIALRLVASALSESGYDVDILAFPLGRAIEIPGVTLYRCRNPLSIAGVPVGFSLKKAALDVSLMQAFAAQLDEHHYDIVHAVEEAAYMAATLCPHHGVPYVFDMASAIPRELDRQASLRRTGIGRIAAMIERRVLGRAGHVICSMGLKSYVQAQAPGVRVSEWRYPALNRHSDENTTAELRRSLNISPEQRVILYAGNFAAYQGMDLLLQAFEIARRKRPELVLVCVGAAEEDRQRVIDSVPATTAESLRIVLRQRRREMPKYLAAADFLVSPRTGTGNMPLKIFDYMASGRPIIATRGSTHEPLLNAHRAALCDANPDALASTLLDLVADPSLAAALSRNAAAYSEAHLSWRSFAEFLDKTYQDAIPQLRREGRVAAVA